MRDSSPVPPRAARLSRRAALGLVAALPLAAASPASAATPVIGGERLARAGVQVRGAAGLPKRLTARSSLVAADHQSGEVLASYRAHAPGARLHAEDALRGHRAEELQADQRHRVTDADLADMPAGSSMVGVKPGITYTVEQLWLGVSWLPATTRCTSSAT